MRDNKADRERIAGDSEVLNGTRTKADRRLIHDVLNADARSLPESEHDAADDESTPDNDEPIAGPITVTVGRVRARTLWN